MKSRPFPLLGKFRFGWLLFWLSVISLVFSLIIGMNESIRNFPFPGMAALGLFAVFWGWIIGGGQRKLTLSLVCSLIFGLILLVLINSSGYRSLIQALLEGFRSSRLVLPYLPGDENIQASILYLHRLIGHLAYFYDQLNAWALSLVHKRGSYDPMITQTLWGTLVWNSSLLTGWLLRRRKHAIISGLPILVLLTGILGYTRQNTAGLVTALSSLLVMTILCEHLRFENKWQINQIDFSEEIRFDIASLGIPIVILIMVIAGVLPNIPLEKIREFYNQNFFPQSEEQTQIDKLLGLEKTLRVLPPNGSSGNLPLAFMIGAGPELSEKLVMEIDTGEFFFPVEVDPGASLPKYYWFGRSYDIYTGNGWATSEISLDDITKDEAIVPADLAASRILQQEIRKSEEAPPTLYSAGIPESVDQRLTVGWRKATGEYYSAQLETLEYKVSAPVLEISDDLLQQANQPAPDFIIENYLQLSAETPTRVLELAASITEDALTPYEKAKAIETYLRQYEYTLDIPSPPQDQDIVDYFLFDLQQGYCDYFASAMVVLARAVDLPARLAVGYATGEYDYGRHLFVVTEENAHAWPEVYISPYGWIPFEPTASLSTFGWSVYPDVARESGDEILTDTAEDKAQPIWLDLFVLIGIIILFTVTFFLRNKIFKRKEKHISTGQQIEKIYQRMKKNLKRLLISPQSSKTPLEFQIALINWLNQHMTSRIDGWLIERIIQNLSNLTGLYQQGIYTPRPLSEIQIKSAKQNLANLLTHTWILNLVFFLKAH